MGAGLIIAAGAKCVGRGHINTSSPCQDAIASSVRGRVGCVALSDGAGSRKYSGKGAQICVNAITSYLVKHFDAIYELANKNQDSARVMILKVVLTALRRHVRRKKYGLDEMACTLLFAAFKDGKLFAGHIGDGVIGLREDQNVRTLSGPENSEYVNSTFFVTDKYALKHLRIYFQDVGKTVGVMLMSDGTAESLFTRSTQECAPVVARIFEWMKKLSSSELSDILEQNLIQVIRNKTMDDCSIVLLATR